MAVQMVAQMVASTEALKVAKRAEKKAVRDSKKAAWTDDSLVASRDA